MNGPQGPTGAIGEVDILLVKRTAAEGAWCVPTNDGRNITVAAAGSPVGVFSVGDRVLEVVPYKDGWGNLRYAKARYEGKVVPVWAPDGLYVLADGQHAVEVRDGRVTGCLRQDSMPVGPFDPMSYAPASLREFEPKTQL